MTTLSNLESAHHKAQEWLNQLTGIGHFDDEQQSWAALKSVLQTLRDRVTVDQAAHLSAQLPMMVRGMFYEGYRPSEVPRNYDTEQEFLNAVRDKLYDARAINAERATRAVFELLQERMDEGEIAQIQGLLPDEINRLWPALV